MTSIVQNQILTSHGNWNRNSTWAMRLVECSRDKGGQDYTLL